MSKKSSTAATALALGILIAAGVAPAQAEPDRCQDPQARCGALVQPVCVQRNGAGAIEASSQGRKLAACQTQLDKYSACLAWVAENCQTRGAAPAGSEGGATVVKKTIRNRTVVEGDLVQGDKVETKIEQNIQVITPGATPEAAGRAVRQHCFIWDNKKMCEPF